MRPSSTASNSIVALSVSISARMSPDFTVSPSLTSHLASLPSSIVGESAGMRIWTDIKPRYPCRVHSARAPGFRWRIRRCVHDGADVLIHRFQIVFLHRAALDQPLAVMFDGIALLAHALHFFACAIFRRIAHRMAAIAIGFHLQNDRAIAFAAPGDGLFAGGMT